MYSTYASNTDGENRVAFSSGEMLDGRSNGTDAIVEKAPR